MDELNAIALFFIRAQVKFYKGKNHKITIIMKRSVAAIALLP
jgi:hypothetical protein